MIISKPSEKRKRRDSRFKDRLTVQALAKGESVALCREKKALAGMEMQAGWRKQQAGALALALAREGQLARRMTKRSCPMINLSGCPRLQVEQKIKPIIIIIRISKRKKEEARFERCCWVFCFGFADSCGCVK